MSDIKQLEGRHPMQHYQKRDTLSSCQHLQRVPRQRLADDDTHSMPELPRPFQDNPRLPVKVPA
jgi:hypothetical protein